MSDAPNLTRILDSQPTVTVPEAARMLSISRQSVYAMVADGRLDALRVGRRVIVKTASLRKMLDD